MLGKLRQAITGKEDGGLRDAMKDKLRGLRGGQAAEPPLAAKPAVASTRPPLQPVAPVVRAPVVDATPAPEPVPLAQPAAVAVDVPAAEASPVVEVVTIETAPILDGAPVVEAPLVVELAAASEPAPAVEVVAPAEPAPVPEVEAAPVSLAAAAAAAAKGEKKAIHADMGSTDIEHYIARAKANGRDPGLIKGAEGMNVADDGERYWGPLDNESSRAKASGKKLTIDQWECISCGTCVEQTDRVFVLPDDAKASPIAQDGPMDLIQDAIEACPVTCIHWVTPEEAAEKGLATGE